MSVRMSPCFYFYMIGNCVLSYKNAPRECAKAYSLYRKMFCKGIIHIENGGFYKNSQRS